jgi:hypothetical protein
MNWTMPPALCVATGPQTRLVLEWELELEYCCSSSLYTEVPLPFLGEQQLVHFLKYSSRQEIFFTHMATFKWS